MRDELIGDRDAPTQAAGFIAAATAAAEGVRLAHSRECKSNCKVRQDLEDMCVRRSRPTGVCDAKTNQSGGVTFDGGKDGKMRGAEW